MDSPSAQLIDGPPSSPFISEIQSRIASKEWQSPVQTTDEKTEDAFMTPRKVISDLEDKENEPQTATKETFFSPLKVSTPNRSHESDTVEMNRDSVEMMPPKSTRKTPKRSPLKAVLNKASTPSTIRRGNSNDNPEAPFGSSDSVRRSRPEPRTPPQDKTNIDDTCFSTFSEIPDMTLFAKIGQSTTKRGDAFRTPGRQYESTPRTSRKRSSPSRSPSPTPRRLKTPAHMNNDGTTNFLIDFTQQMENISSYRPSSPAKSSTQPDLLNYLNSQRSPNKSSRQSFATPAKSSSLLNLLDFELPPAPTPRSIPTITVRELESLKSSYLSQISSLKATLSGREAEVESLKRAIGDAERRAGEAQEAFREEKCRRENAEEEKTQWERRGQEVENVLKNVREEVLKCEAEKDDLVHKLEENERRIDDAEERAVKAEERYADALSARAMTGDSNVEGSGSEGAVEERVQKLVSAQIDSKIEAVSRELHAVYKEKHERKVATLKKSYESRAEKKCAELQSRLAELEKFNEELQAAKDATFSGPLPDASIIASSSSGDADLKAQIEEQKAHLARLENEIKTSRKQQEQLIRELERERIEKGDLVAAVDEMLALQSEQGGSSSNSSSVSTTQQGTAMMSVVEDFRKSIGRPPTGMRVPSAAGESRIGRGGVGGFGLGRSFSGLGKGNSKAVAGLEKSTRSAGGDGDD